MLLGVAVLLLAAAQAPASARAADGPACLSSGDAWDAVSARSVVAPARAIRGAREAVPRAAVLRAALCREPDSLVYRIIVLREDGRMVRVTVDAPSGKVTSIR